MRVYELLFSHTARYRNFILCLLPESSAFSHGNLACGVGSFSWTAISRRTYMFCCTWLAVPKATSHPQCENCTCGCSSVTAHMCRKVKAKPLTL